MRAEQRICVEVELGHMGSVFFGGLSTQLCFASDGALAIENYTVLVSECVLLTAVAAFGSDTCLRLPVQATHGYAVHLAAVSMSCAMKKATITAAWQTATATRRVRHSAYTVLWLLCTVQLAEVSRNCFRSSAHSWRSAASSAPWDAGLLTIACSQPCCKVQEGPSCGY